MIKTKMAEGGSDGGDWWGGWLQAAKDKTVSAVGFLKQDLAEFGCVVHNETKDVVAKSASVVKDKLATEQPGSTGNMMKDGITHFLGNIQKALYVPPDDDGEQKLKITPTGVIYDRAQARVYAIQIDPGTYCQEPEGPPEKYKEWLEKFQLEDKKGEISELLVARVEVRSLYTQLVPSEISHADFWRRYFYKLHQLEEDEIRKKDLMKRAESAGDEDDLGWDDDWEEVEEFSTRNMSPDKEKSPASPEKITAVKGDAAASASMPSQNILQTDVEKMQAVTAPKQIGKQVSAKTGDISSEETDLGDGPEIKSGEQPAAMAVFSMFTQSMGKLKDTVMKTLEGEQEWSSSGEEEEEIQTSQEQQKDAATFQQTNVSLAEKKGEIKSNERKTKTETEKLSSSTPAEVKQNTVDENKKAEESERLRLQKEKEAAEIVKQQQEKEAAEIVRLQLEKEKSERLRQQKEEEAENLKQQKEKEEAERLRQQKEKEEAERLRQQKEKEAERLRQKKEKEEAERLRQQKEEEERLRQQKEKEETERLRQQKEKEEAERLRLQKEKEEAERLKQQKEKEEAERLRQQKEKEEAERLRLQKEKEEAERLKQQKEKEEAERLRQQKEKEEAERLRLQKEKEEAERLKQQKEKEEAERLRQQKEKEEAERLRLQKEKEEAERLKQQKEKEEAERLRQQKEKEEAERLRLQKEEEEAERQKEKEEVERLRKEKEAEILRQQKEKEEAELAEKQRKEKEEADRLALAVTTGDEKTSADKAAADTTSPETSDEDIQGQKDIQTKEKGDLVMVGSNRTTPTSEESNNKELSSLEDDWEKDFDIEVTEEDLQLAAETAKKIGATEGTGDQDDDIGDDWEDWE
ncbi:BSD domain-containing protein 1 [Lingula anatina]|uniref:BSD domain-containing protein 1 n=1 Tax=Lingula anatina TaxID=7574 RepID=A0A1S3H1P0_LINAN|nr:BSD domain-containing protein 1 [Lingula anatina]|eukprot:XP_013380045.1 BSD domain-containing protein 1 [Lingula anatina]